MKSPLFGSLAVLFAAAVLATPAVRAEDASSMPVKKILFFSKSSGFEHSAIKDPSKWPAPKPGKDIPGIAFTILKDLGAKDNIDFTFSKDGSLFTPDYLAQFDAYMFYTTGDLTTPGTDKNPPMSPEGKTAFLNAIAGGKGFIGVHSATDTFHTQSNRYVNDGDKADDYIKMIGGEFVIHGKQQKSHLIIADSKFPGISVVPSDTSITEEWYSMKDFAPDMHVLLVQDTTGMEGNPYARPNYPSTWIRMHGKGRVFYTNMGHRDDMWTSALYQGLVTAGINWAVGRTEADVTPNLDQVAPKASTLPPEPPPVAPKKG